MNIKTILSIALGTLSLLLVIVGCGETKDEQVSFSRQVMPILKTHCLMCHNPEGEGFKKSGLSMESHAALMKGTKFGPVVVPGNAVSSSLVILIDGKGDPTIKMPHGSLQLLPKSDREIIKQWINQGAKNN